jgi:hypothetical protein
MIFPAFLFAYMFWVCLTLGCFGLMLLHHMLRGTWGLAILRLLEAGSKTLFLMAPLFLVLVAGLKDIYPWANPERVAHDVILQKKLPYLNPTGFAARGIIYFVIWIIFAVVLIASAKRQDQSGDPAEAQKRANIAAPGFVLFVITVTLAVTDWVMSVDPHWFSTIFGFWFIIGQGLAAMSFCVIYIVSRRNQKPYSDIVTPKLTRDHGNLMLMMTMVWAYFTFSQFLIMWSGNIPDEVGYYFHRMQASWNILGTIVVVGQFFIPFLLLLSGRTKREPTILLPVACWIFGTRILDLYWNIAPFFVKDTETAGPIQMAGPFLIAWIVVGALWLGCFEFFRRQSSVLPTHDPRLLMQEAAHHA